MIDILLLLVAAAQATGAETPNSPAAVSNPSITVTADNRIVCRRSEHTETRIGNGRVCRTVAQWRHEDGDDDNPNATIDGAADSLQQVDQRISTSDIGGELTRANGRTPLGPR